MAQLARRDSSGRLASLENLTGLVAADLHELSDALTADYLSHQTPSPLTSSL
jgi:hypothetical protein